MAKLIQNKIAESKLSLPIAATMAVIVWLSCGMLAGHWWAQFGCFAATTYIMIELNNANALIRIYSRMVSCTFLALSCCTCFLFPSLSGCAMQTCFAMALLILFQSYQDKLSMGKTFYGFLFLGTGSLLWVPLLYFVPLFWLLMATHLLTLSWRTWGAALCGLAAPYWFGGCWLLCRYYIFAAAPISMPDAGRLVAQHFAPLADFRFPIDYGQLSTSQLQSLLFLAILAVIGIAHQLRQRHQDKIRTRLLYSFLIWSDLLVFLFLALQPHQCDMLLRLATICTAPLFAHYIALTSTKVTNAVCCTAAAAAAIITIYNIWITSSLF